MGLGVVVAGCDDVQYTPPLDQAAAVDLASPSLDSAKPLDAARAADLGPPPDAGQPTDAAQAPDMHRPGVGSLLFNVIDDETGLTIPARVIIAAVAPTPPVRFDINNAGVVLNGETAAGVAPGILGAPEGVMLMSGAGSLRIPAGTYDLFITHGPEWEADSRRVSLGGMDTVEVTAALRHSVDTTGWLSADLHIHTLRSFDSHLQLDARVVSEVSVGTELLVATDHNVLTDLQPVVAQLGYGSVARAIVGDEFNFSEGHGGAYPMPYDPNQADNGVSQWKLDWDTVKSIHGADMFPSLHAFPTHPAVTVNHPRLLPDLGYFTNLGWAPPMPLADAGKFDAIELLNGYMQAPDDAAAIMRDWFFLLSSGTKVAVLGSSDTHRLGNVKAGFPRSWLRMPTENVGKIMDADLALAIKGGHAIASNGPFASLTVDGVDIGDTDVNTGKQALVDATVDVPTWMDLTEVRLYVNGVKVEERMVTPGTRPAFHDRIPITLPGGDAWVVLEANGKQSLPVALIGDYEGGRVVPFVITNPVYIEGDGDATWKPRLGKPSDADPGPIPPLARGDQGPPSQLEVMLQTAVHDLPEDCEPPLWVAPSLWVNP